MELTIKVKDTAFKAAIDYRMQYLFDDFDDSVIKAAGYDRRATAEALFKDEKFKAAIGKDLAENLESRGYLHDLVAETVYAPLTKMYRTMERIHCKLAAAEREAQTQTDKIKDAIQVLTSAGYKVVEKA